MAIVTKAINSILNNLDAKLIDTTKYNDLQALTNEDRLFAIKLMNLAFKHIIKELVEASLPIHLPYIGTLRIKEINKIALRVKEEVAIEFGYNSYNDVPADKINEIKDIISKRIIIENNDRKEKLNNIKEKIKEEKSKEIKKKRVNKKILTFDINKITKK